MIRAKFGILSLQYILSTMDVEVTFSFLFMAMIYLVNFLLQKEFSKNRTNETLAIKREKAPFKTC